MLRTSSNRKPIQIVSTVEQTIKMAHRNHVTYCIHVGRSRRELGFFLDGAEKDVHKKDVTVFYKHAEKLRLLRTKKIEIFCVTLKARISNETVLYLLHVIYTSIGLKYESVYKTRKSSFVKLWSLHETRICRFSGSCILL